MSEDKEKVVFTEDKKSKAEEAREHTTPRLFLRRWLILLLFCCFSMSNAFQWIHLNIIGNIILRYYNESLPGDEFQQQLAVDWLSMIYMLAYIPLIFPATWLLDRKGLRVVSLAATFLNCLGAWLKCASVDPSRFGVLMFAQTVCAIAQIFILGIPARLAAVWFGPNEVSTATALGVFGNQVGVAIGFLVPPVIVKNHDDLNLVGRDFSIMFYATAGVTTALFLLVITVFKKQPPTPPSKAQAIIVEQAAEEKYSQSLVRLVKNRCFMLLMITYGVNTGSYYGISTLLNPLVLYYCENCEEHAGRIGLTIVLAGVLGSIVAGIWLDKTKKFKLTTVAIYFLSMAGMVLFTFTLDQGILWVLYLCGGILGFFMTGYLPVGFEFAAELTYPESEGTSSGLLNASAQFFGIVFTTSMGALLNKFGPLAANATVSGALLLGTIGTALIKGHLRRQEAEKKGGQLTAFLTADDIVDYEL
ncbi:feline leukemia virus subgroup C receptor-related protein 1 isoform X2 [Lingula anatina]|uniref:Choline/ethanolamine transporter FLVCR1 n=1 Tax=Lingula anatina TaxID=7574 RepID=A0A1S3HV83_LINAN|nr:feline leukemia virus subgroup C receptor-related protein 1 isoform X2 [Lingula anatina]|eukprot:XP_013389952.1 feline leukemia virus subgroup C receptor-related protein 1 isoform X2 [Lingula anatina]